MQTLQRHFDSCKAERRELAASPGAPTPGFQPLSYGDMKLPEAASWQAKLSNLPFSVDPFPEQTPITMVSMIACADPTLHC